MIIEEYEVVWSDRSEAGKAIKEMARKSTWRASRLFSALEDFVVTKTRFSCRAAPDAESAVEVYLVPPRYVLAHLPDAAALVKVGHGMQKIELVHVFQEYGGAGEKAQWRAAQSLALSALE